MELICGIIVAITFTVVLTLVPYGAPWLDNSLGFLRNSFAGCGVGWVVSRLFHQRWRKRQDRQIEEVFERVRKQTQLLIDQHNQGVRKPWEPEEQEPKVH